MFDRERPGFDAITGNPPFMAGKNTVAAGNPAELYLALAQAALAPRFAHGNADLVAHFFRRAFNLVREGGTFGLIATNTIGQGDTRATGLRWICTHGGEIYRARRRLKWPGLAAVVVSVIHVHKGPFAGAKHLDERRRRRRSPRSSSTAAATRILPGWQRQRRQELRRQLRSIGMGFLPSTTTDRKGVAIAAARDAPARGRRSAEPAMRSSPTSAAQEVNTSPTHAHHRYVINFRDYPLRREDLQRAVGRRRRRPAPRVAPAQHRSAGLPRAGGRRTGRSCLTIVEERVKAGRAAKLGDNGDARRWKEQWWL